MNLETTLNPTFWSGVINFIKASADSAEVSRRRQFSSIPDSKTVLVFRTTVDTPDFDSQLGDRLDQIAGNRNWTIDFEDVDRVLRIVCEAREETTIIGILNEAGYACDILA